jgi:predicted regulator of Ras-like GTPase activity (Roadblock/LC7/MglB family)
MHDELKEEAKPKLATETCRLGSGGGPGTRIGSFDGGNSGYSGGGGGGGYGASRGDDGNLSRQIQELLPKLSVLPGVIGSAAIHYDGTPIADNLAKYPGLDSFSMIAAKTYATTYDSIKKFGHRGLYQLAFKSDKGFVYMADFDHGLLITLINTQDLSKMIALFKTVRLLIGAQSSSR